MDEHGAHPKDRDDASPHPSVLEREQGQSQTDSGHGCCHHVQERTHQAAQSDQPQKVRRSLWFSAQVVEDVFREHEAGC